VLEEGKQTPAPDSDATTGSGRRLLCHRCRAPITTDDQRIAVNDRHEHYFVNPHGYDFHVGCFAAAPGALGAGPSTHEWTWFSGFTWQLDHCRNCSTHLGWLFRSPTQVFHGLILARLNQEED
jgi:hypothetical protein